MFRPTGLVYAVTGIAVMCVAGTALTAIPEAGPVMGPGGSGPIGPGQAVSVQIVSLPRNPDTPQIDFSELSASEQQAMLRRLIAAGRLDIATAMVETLVAAGTLSLTDGRMILARLLAEDGQAPAAIDQYRRILAQDESRVDARLELGRLLFMDDDYDAARENFRIARTDPGLSAEAAAVVDAYVDAMTPRDPWQFDAAIGIAPDSNVTQGTTIDEIELFGLPLRLSESMRQSTGIGVFGNASVEYSPELPLSFGRGVRTDLRLGAGIGHVAYDDPDLASTVASGHAGLRFRHDGGSTSVLAVASAHWQGLGQSLGQGLGHDFLSAIADPVAADVGGRLEIDRRLDARTRFDGYLDIRYRDFPDLRERNGVRVLADGTVTYEINARSFVRGNVRFDRTASGLPVNAYSSLGLGGGYYYDFEAPFAVFLRGSADYRLYDERPFFSPENRVDHRFDASIDVTYQEPVLFGFAPVLRYGYTYNVSTVDIYQYDRHRLDIGLTRRF